MDDNKDTLYMVLGFLSLWVIFWVCILIDSGLTNDCRQAAIAKGYTAVEIQAICK